MRVKILETTTGPGCSFRAGQVVEVADKLARRWIESREAESAEPANEPRDGTKKSSDARK